MSEAWMVQYKYGRLTIQSVEVVKSSAKQVVLKRGNAASGYKTHVPAHEVFWSEEAAWEEAGRLVTEAIAHARNVLKAHEAWAADVATNLARLRTPAEATSPQ